MRGYGPPRVVPCALPVDPLDTRARDRMQPSSLTRSRPTADSLLDHARASCRTAATLQSDAHAAPSARAGLTRCGGTAGGLGGCNGAGRTDSETASEWRTVSLCVDGRLVCRVFTRHAGPVTLRPTIRPGAPLLRRDATHLQVGTSPGTVFDDRPGLRLFLRLLNGARDVDQLRRLVRSDVPELEGDVDDVLRPLLACGAVVDASLLQIRRPRLRVALHEDASSRPLARAIGHALADLGIGSLGPPDPDLLLSVR